MPGGVARIDNGSEYFGACRWSTQVRAASQARTAFRPGYQSVKRLIDFIAAVMLLPLSAPVLGMAALAISLETRASPFFSQERVGRNGRRFRIYKLRTMRTWASPYSYKLKADDPAITRVGRLLRRAGFDELPQLVNVLRGDMSLIGPRPELPFIVETYEMWQYERLDLRPGITGWWQVHHRNDSPMHLGTEFDLFYIRNCGPALDAKIALLTVVLMATGLLRGFPKPWLRG